MFIDFYSYASVGGYIGEFMCSCIFNRLLQKAGGELTPDSILKLRASQMRAVGLSNQKLTYIRDLAKKTKLGKMNFEMLPTLSDEEVVAHLTQIKGIGVWTAHMFLIFALRRENVLPTGDLGCAPQCAGRTK